MDSKDTNQTPLQRQLQDKGFISQKKRVFKAFSMFPMTMKMAELVSGVDRANICRFIAEWRENGRVCKIKTSICPVTKYPKVGFYTNDLELIKGLGIQSKLF